MKPETQLPMVYSGTFERSLDPKNRVTIPARWLEGEGQEFQLVPKPNEPYLLVLPPAEFAAMEDRIEGLPISEAEKRRAIRMFYASARPVTVDKQGRILLPEEMVAKAELGSEVVLVGSKSRFEIWQRARWNESAAAAQPDFAHLANQIGL